MFIFLDLTTIEMFPIGLYNMGTLDLSDMLVSLDLGVYQANPLCPYYNYVLLLIGHNYCTSLFASESNTIGLLCIYSRCFLMLVIFPQHIPPALLPLILAPSHPSLTKIAIFPKNHFKNHALGIHNFNIYD